MKHIKLIITLVILSCFSVTAQTKATKSADKHFSKLEFVEAIEDYEKLIEKGEGDAYIYGQLAIANYNIFNTVEAEKWFAKALETNQEPEMVFKYSEMLKANGKYEASNAQMKTFASMRPGDDRSVMFMANPDYLPKILDRGKKFNVQNMDINSAVSDFGGTMQDGKLYITTARNGARKKYGWNEQPFLDIYEFTLAEDGTYQGETMVEDKINTKYHEGVVSFSPDGKTMYFSRESFFENIYEKDSLSNTKYSVLHLFKATKGSDGFSNIEALPINSRNYSIKNPSVSPDGSTIYFASDMPGGFGKFDIYKASIDENGQVGAPVNMGQKVNTEGHEMFPFISDNNTLYFSSIGHLGLGGMDVFYTKEIDGKMAPVRNVGIPVNSNGDDFAFHINEETGEGFVSSNREGGKGDDDIYYYELLAPKAYQLYSGQIMDKDANSPIPFATVKVYNERNVLEKEIVANDKGEYSLKLPLESEYTIMFTKPGYTQHTSVVRTMNTPDLESKKNLVLLVSFDQFVVKDGDVEKIKVNPIFFESFKYAIAPQAEVELKKIILAMNSFPKIRIRIESHTDSRGPDLLNYKLSNQRARSTYDYLIANGIDPSRIESAIGYGETELRNYCINGVKCTEDEHLINRRSDFIIVSK